MAAEQGSTRPVVLTEDCTVNVMEAIPGHQSVSTGRTAETLQQSENKKEEECFRLAFCEGMSNCLHAIILNKGHLMLKNDKS